tara:strand:- start:3381 stop:4118 length:738 start_codon:yes stop_codon:yes gene_type:complete
MSDQVINEDKILTVDEKEKKKYIIALAFQGEQFSSKFLLCWTNTLSFLWQSGDYEFLIACGDNSSIFHSRLRTLGLNNEIHTPFNNNKFDYWISIDNNMLFSPQHIIDLINSLEEHHVVSGLYKADDAINYNAIKNIDNNDFIKNGSFKYLVQDELDMWKKDMESKYIPVDYVGLSFFGARSEVLQKLEYPFFNGDNIILKKEDGTNYNIVPSEDYNFCKNIKDAGYQIMLNTDLRLGNAVKLVV